MQAMSWGRGVPQIATGYGKMLPTNNITGPVITGRNRRKMNQMTGSRKVKTGLLGRGPVLSPMKKAPSWH